MQTTPPRSLWLDEALAAEREPTTAALEGTTRADVCIVGGGYAGLWTALKVKAAEPAVDVVILERDRRRLPSRRLAVGGGERRPARPVAGNH